jgi:hypothetical protein
VDTTSSQPFDDRHFPPVEDAAHYASDGFVMQNPGVGIPEGMTPTVWPEVDLSHGLTWTFAPGHKLSDLGRLGTDAVESLDMLDLRVILAHLDSAATVIKTELDRRI